MEGAESESAPFRVSVSLEAFFSDERARCYVSVEAARRVGWLQRRLRALLPLPAAFCLLADGHLLPPAEPLALLRPDDCLTAVPTRNEECYPADEAASSASPPRAARGLEAAAGEAEGEAGAALREAKRRALADLEAGAPPARRPRRRVRRRRARAPGDDDSPAGPTPPAHNGAPPAPDPPN